MANDGLDPVTVADVMRASMNDAPEGIGRPTESDADGAEWLSVTQLAERRGISRASAARLIRRYKWPRRTDNLTRTTSYLVPVHAQEESGRPTEAAAVTALREAVALAREQFDALKAEHDALRIRAGTAEAERDDLRGRLEAAADSLRMAQERAGELEAADAERRSRGRWARLRAAWLGE